MKSFTVLLLITVDNRRHHKLALTELEEEVWNFGSADIIPFIVFPNISVILFILLMHYCHSFYYCYFIISRSNHSIINWFITGYSGAHGVSEYLKRLNSNNNKKTIITKLEFFLFLNKLFQFLFWCFRR